MDVRWLKSSQDKEKRREEVLRYRNAFEDLKILLENEVVKDPSVRDYESPGWVHQQIAANERNKALQDVIKLITFKD